MPIAIFYPFSEHLTLHSWPCSVGKGHSVIFIAFSPFLQPWNAFVRILDIDCTILAFSIVTSLTIEF